MTTESRKNGEITLAVLYEFSVDSYACDSNVVEYSLLRAV